MWGMSTGVVSDADRRSWSIVELYFGGRVQNIEPLLCAQIANCLRLLYIGVNG